MQLFNRDSDYVAENKGTNATEKSSFQFRMLLAVILFAILILFDKSNSKTAETAIENFTKAISADVEEKLEHWVEKNIKFDYQSDASTIGVISYLSNICMH